MGVKTMFIPNVKTKTPFYKLKSSAENFGYPGVYTQKDLIKKTKFVKLWVPL